MIRYALIFARDLNWNLGRGGRVPWRVPGDLRWFRTHTAGKLCLVGARTYLGLPPLPGRQLIVVGRDPPHPLPRGVVAWVPTAHAARGEVIRRVIQGGAHPEVMVIGGAALYREFLAGMDGEPLRAYETELEVEVGGADCAMPELPGVWREVFTHTEDDPYNQLDDAAGWSATYRILERSGG